MKKSACFSAMIVTAIVVLSLSSAVVAQEDLPYFLQDRGAGILNTSSILRVALKNDK